jgi:hypothetical protein
MRSNGLMCARREAKWRKTRMNWAPCCSSVILQGMFALTMIEEHNSHLKRSPCSEEVTRGSHKIPHILKLAVHAWEHKANP